MECIAQPFSLQFVKQLDLPHVRLKIAPRVIVHRYDHFRVERLAHANEIRRRHLVGDPNRIVRVSPNRHINRKLLAVLDKLISIVRIARVINDPAARLQHVIDRLIVHRTVGARDRVLRQLRRPIE